MTTGYVSRGWALMRQGLPVYVVLVVLLILPGPISLVAGMALPNDLGATIAFMLGYGPALIIGALALAALIGWFWVYFILNAAVCQLAGPDRATRGFATLRKGPMFSLLGRLIVAVILTGIGAVVVMFAIAPLISGAFGSGVGSMNQFLVVGVILGAVVLALQSAVGAFCFGLLLPGAILSMKNALTGGSAGQGAQAQKVPLRHAFLALLYPYFLTNFALLVFSIILQAAAPDLMNNAENGLFGIVFSIVTFTVAMLFGGVLPLLALTTVVADHWDEAPDSPETA